MTFANIYVDRVTPVQRVRGGMPTVGHDQRGRPRSATIAAVEDG